MTNQPDPNLNDEKREITRHGGDHNVAHGNVGPGAVIGRGTVTAESIAGRDIINNGTISETHNQFSALLEELQGLIQDARDHGELDENRTQEVIDSLQSAALLIEKEDEEKPIKEKIVSKLQYVTDVIDAAVDTFAGDDGPARFLLKALPVVALLIKLATRIF